MFNKMLMLISLLKISYAHFSQEYNIITIYLYIIDRAEKMCIKTIDFYLYI